MRVSLHTRTHSHTCVCARVPVPACPTLAAPGRVPTPPPPLQRVPFSYPTHVSHATYVPEAQRGPRFKLSDGVGCESCHGPGGQFVSTHVQPTAQHAGNIAAGMYPTDRELLAALRGAREAIDAKPGTPEFGALVAELRHEPAVAEIIARRVFASALSVILAARYGL